MYPNAYGGYPTPGQNNPQTTRDASTPHTPATPQYFLHLPTWLPPECECECPSTSSIDMYNNDGGSDQPQIYEVKRHSNERHLLFYFMSFTNPCSPLTATVIVHTVYINEPTL